MGLLKGLGKAYIKAQSKKTGTASLIEKYKDLVSKTKAPLEKNKNAVEQILKYHKKHGGTELDVKVGEKIKNRSKK